MPHSARTAEDTTPRGWRIDRLPHRALRHEERGNLRRIVLPLWLLKDGKHVADLELVMSPTEAEQLHTELGRALDTLRALACWPRAAEVPEVLSPECRLATAGPEFADVHALCRGPHLTLPEGSTVFTARCTCACHPDEAASVTHSEGSP